MQYAHTYMLCLKMLHDKNSFAPGATAQRMLPPLDRTRTNPARCCTCKATGAPLHDATSALPSTLWIVMAARGLSDTSMAWPAGPQSSVPTDIQPVPTPLCAKLQLLQVACLQHMPCLTYYFMEAMS